MFRLQIATGNDPFAHPGGAYELERILREVGETVRFCVTDATTETASAKLRDAAGNTVGEWSLNAPEGEEGAHSSPPEDSGTALAISDPARYPAGVAEAAARLGSSVEDHTAFSSEQEADITAVLQVAAAVATGRPLVAAWGREPSDSELEIIGRELDRVAPGLTIWDKAAVVAWHLNLIAEAARLEKMARDEGCVSLLADLDAGKPVHLEAAATIRGMVRELAEHEGRNAAQCAAEAG